jgi:hypothetical protein
LFFLNRRLFHPMTAMALVPIGLCRRDQRPYAQSRQRATVWA